MYLYIIAGSDEGPCKVGISNRPENRLSAVQSGNPNPLALRYVEHVGFHAPLIERAMHLALTPRRCAAANEWFQMRPEDAHRVFRIITAASDILLSQTVTINHSYNEQALSWVKE
jgi:hypothetical protein